MNKIKRFIIVLISSCLFLTLFIAFAHLYIYRIPNKNHLFETALSRVLQEPVSIRAVHIEGFLLNPTLKLDDIDIKKNSNSSSVLHFSHLIVSFNLWKSLLETRLRTQVVSARIESKYGKFHIVAQLSNVFSKAPILEDIYMRGDHVLLQQFVSFFSNYDLKMKAYENISGQANFRAWLNADENGWRRLQAQINIQQAKYKWISEASFSAHFLLQKEPKEWELLGTFDRLNLIDESMLHHIQGVRGEYRFTPTRGALQLTGDGVSLMVATHPMIGDLFSKLSWRKEQEVWRLRVEALKWDSQKERFSSQFTAVSNLEQPFQVSVLGDMAYNDLLLNHVHILVSPFEKAGLKIRASSVLSMSLIHKHASFSMLHNITGKSQVSALAVIPNLFSPVVDKLTISSNLKGISLVKFPAPFQKPAEAILPTFSTIEFLRNGIIKISGKLGNIVSVALMADEKKHVIISGNIHFGDRMAQFQPLPGVLVNGYILYLDADQWNKWCGVQSPSGFALKSIRKVDLMLGDIHVFGQNLPRLSMRVYPDAGDLKVQLRGKDVLGDIYFPSSKEMPIRADFKKLFMHVAKHASENMINPISIPPLNIVVDDLKINDRSAEKFKLETHPIADGLSIQAMKIDSPLLRLSVRGRWLAHGQDQETVLTGNMQSDDVGKLLLQRKLSSRLKGGDLSSEFALRWPGSPQQFSIQHANGNISFFMRNGTIMELDSNIQTNIAIARMLSLLSLESLSHIIKFRFSGLTHRGFSFDDFRGKCDVDHGFLLARNMSMESNIAKVKITGKISLENQSNDLKMFVTPALSSGLSAVAGLAAGPVVGATTWVASKLFSDNVDALMKREYRITGTWDQPKIS